MRTTSSPFDPTDCSEVQFMFCHVCLCCLPTSALPCTNCGVASTCDPVQRPAFVRPPFPCPANTGVCTPGERLCRHLLPLCGHAARQGEAGPTSVES
eukprot:1161031-Pelagomonas_calceolata.AAC.1